MPADRAIPGDPPERGTRKGRRRVRLPLQTGASAANRVGVGLGIYFAACSALGLVMFGKSVELVVIITIVCIVPFFLIGQMFWPWRASDIEVDDAGFVVRGGPLAGTTGSWSTIDASRIRALRDPAPTLTSNAFSPMYASRLYVGLRDGRDVTACSVLADTDDEGFLATIVDILRALAAPPPAAPPAVPPGTKLVTCDGCGAPVAPDDCDFVVCPFCGQHAYVPADVRERLAAERELDADRAALARMVRVTLAQPHAGSVNARLGALVTLYVGGLLAANVALFWLHRWDVAAYCFAAVVAALALLRAAIADRVALRTIVFGFGARRATDPKAPPACRACGAPLPVAKDDAILVYCAYCGAENVVEIDVIPQQTTVATATFELGAALIHRMTARQRLIRSLLVAVCFAAVGVCLWAVNR